MFDRNIRNREVNIFVAFISFPLASNCQALILLRRFLDENINFWM